MNVHEVLSRCRDLGVILAPGPAGTLRVSPPGRLPAELRQELKRCKGEVLALLIQPSWPCLHCGRPAEIEAVEPSLDGQRMLTFWNCQRCEVWGVTPSTLREPPVWVSKREQ